MCGKYEKFYIGRKNKNVKARFKEFKKDFIYGERLSNFANHVIEDDHKMIHMDDIMTVLHKENNYEKIGKL